MKRLALVLICLASVAHAGGMAEPVMEPAVLEAETASSANDNWVGIMMLALTIGAAVAN